MRPDADLQQLVMQVLARDASIDETAIGVSVQRGVVTLTGFVGSYDEKHAAEDIAHRVPGVLDVANDLQVELSSHTNPTDPEIAEAARNALASDANINHEHIHTTVAARGHVTLTGSVLTLREREAAEKTVRRVDGVGIVTNQIMIETPATSPSRLREMIESALERHLARAIGRIEVEIHGETVVLSGTVDSLAERRTVVGAVKGTPGIKHVDDRLQITTPADPGHAAT